MFGVGVGMLYTPILVDRLQLTFPSGLAVANILRALTDSGAAAPARWRQLGGGVASGLVGGIGSGQGRGRSARSSCRPRRSAPA